MRLWPRQLQSNSKLVVPSLPSVLAGERLSATNVTSKIPISLCSAKILGRTCVLL